MKQLSINRISAASIRANRKTYISLAVGILLAVFLATVVVLCAFGIIRAEEQKTVRVVGYTDCVLLDEPDISDESLRASGLFAAVGRQFVLASVKEHDVCLGYIDEEGQEILCRSCVEGRMPTQPGEIAVERSALEKLRLDRELGDTVTWTLLPVDGVEEERSFTIVGILNEQSASFDVSAFFGMSDSSLAWPAALISPDESFATGRAVVHRAMTYAPLAGFSQAANRYPGARLFGVSRTQAMVFPDDPAAYDASSYLQYTGMLLILGLSLLLAVCIGISSAMESVLASKTEEIGMLRAVGATRRQIRRIFGRDAWLLSFVALPVGLVLGILAAWLLCRLSPGEMLFSLRIWLLVPILAVSALCVFVSSGLPLRRASRQMPMGVLRDTALLRKTGRIRSRAGFRPTELIAGRQLRIHPWRQLGAALMVTATLLCTAFVGEMVYDALSELARDKPVAFSLAPQGFIPSSRHNFAAAAPGSILSGQDIAQIRGLPRVEYASLEEQTSVNLILEGELPAYFQSFAGSQGQGNDGETTWIYSIFGGGSGMNYLALSEDAPEPPAAAYDDDVSAWQRRNAWERNREMRAAAAAQQVDGRLVPFYLYVVDLSRVDFRDRLAEGKVDLAAIDAGREVLVYAPTYYVSELDDGSYLASTYTMRGSRVLDEYHNDYFYAGQPLRLMQLICEDNGEAAGDYDGLLYEYTQMERHDAAVTVGAVLEGRPIRDGVISLFTTERGAEALGIPMTHIAGMSVSLDGDVDLETEQALQSRLERIAMRGGMHVYNWLQGWREEVESMKQAMTLFVSMLLLFFTVAVAMQVSNAGRRIRADSRMIGTLRAVGADEKALLGCYRLPLLLTTAAGSILAVLGYTGFVIWFHSLVGEWLHPLTVAPAMLLLGALCALCCLAGARRKLKTVLEASIVENIREL